MDSQKQRFTPIAWNFIRFRNTELTAQWRMFYRILWLLCVLVGVYATLVVMVKCGVNIYEWGVDTNARAKAIRESVVGSDV